MPFYYSEIEIQGDLQKLVDIVNGNGINVINKYTDKLTLFGNELKAFLKKITINCNTYIDSVFNNNKDDPSKFTCPHHSSILGLYDTTRSDNNGDKIKLIETFLDLLEKVPISVSPYKTYIMKFKENYLNKMKANEERRQDVLTYARINQDRDKSPPSYTDSSRKNYETQQKETNIRNNYTLNLEYYLNLNYDEQIALRLETISGIQKLHRGHLKDPYGDDLGQQKRTLIIPKREENYEEFDYFLILKDRNIDDTEKILSTYEKYLKATLSLAYLNTQSKEINDKYTFYINNQKSIKPSAIEEHENARIYWIQKHNDYAEFKAQYEKDISEYKASLKLKGLYMSEKEKLLNELKKNPSIMSRELDELSFYQLSTNYETGFLAVMPR